MQKKQYGNKQYPEQEKMYIGSAWNKTVKTKDGSFDMINIAFMGNQDKDQYEVVLLNKTDGSYIQLHSKPHFVKLVPRKTKEKENSPDYSVTLFFPKEE